jgi:hypothetical protein
MAQQDFIPLVELLDRIAGLWAQGHTGTVMLVSDDNRMAQIHLQGGNIIFVLCRGRRGREGLNIMRTIQRARMSLDRPSVANNEPIEWSTEVILDYLYGTIDELPAPTGPVVNAGPGAAPRLAPAAAAAATPARTGAFVLTPAQRDTFERTMANYIGPMASIVCGDYFDSATDLRSLASKLASEIPGADQAEKFKFEIGRALDIGGL